LENFTARVIYPVESALSFYYGNDCGFSTTTTTLENKKRNDFMLPSKKTMQARASSPKRGRGVLVVRSKFFFLSGIKSPIFREEKNQKKSKKALFRILLFRVLVEREAFDSHESASRGDDNRYNIYTSKRD